MLKMRVDFRLQLALTFVARSRNEIICRSVVADILVDKRGVVVNIEVLALRVNTTEPLISTRTPPALRTLTAVIVSLLKIYSVELPPMR